MEIKKKILRKYYAEKDEEIEKIAAAKKEYKNGYISKSEYDIIIEGATCNIESAWDRFQEEFETIIGYRCGFATELIPCAFEILKIDIYKKI